MRDIVSGARSDGAAITGKTRRRLISRLRTTVHPVNLYNDSFLVESGR